ncbi:ferrous iron transport protein A [Anaerobacillus alkalidiazotrophicus]|uniref:Ferrous iron transport protein A n=1 Tax=Anaerobacillus alkalidiazotrophicus TaxID=472963 RepID=A0A1S2M2F9_9BACI|nr:ferrous iron transport protein A [Anaerobacillus alkalidiazotrophicus]OIJ18918.1 ferrous iron transport protein A [Anaerobacillus alkalidiazotrophicus]
MLLSLLKRGQKGIVSKIDHPTLRIEALRFGIGVGQSIECCEVIPAGPIIIRKGNQEIAIGRELANVITISKQV